MTISTQHDRYVLVVAGNPSLIHFWAMATFLATRAERKRGEKQIYTVMV